MPDRRILIIDDDADVLAGLAALLTHTGWDVGTAATGQDGLKKFAELSPDIVLLDVNLPDASGIDLLDQMKAYSEETPIIVMSGLGTIDIAVAAMRKGAETFLTKPYDIDNLELVLEQASKVVALQRELAVLRRSSRNSETRIRGVSAAAGELRDMIERIASAPSPVLLQGESGSGKGIVAQIIHDRSLRAKAPFVDLNCAGFSRELFESELFGHERGAFTDAGSAKQGLLEIATGGTVFLDEIGELELSIQARLLKALEEKRFRRVGGVRDIHVDIRLIAATNRNLAQEVEAGRFRKDLFYRLNVVRIEIPPLRKRLEDIPILAEEMIGKLRLELLSEATTLSDRAMQKLMSYSWPGNVRELRNVLERALLVAQGKEIKAEDLLLAEGGAAPSSTAATGTDIRPLDEVTAAYVKKTVEALGGNIREAARRLEVSPSTVYAKLKKGKR